MNAPAAGAGDEAMNIEATDIEVAEARVAGALVLLPAGRLDSANARSFEALVMERIGGGERRLVVDFSQLDFISSSGLRVLLIAAKALQADAGKLVLCCMKNHIEDVLRISGFDRIIAIKASRAEALEACS